MKHPNQQSNHSSHRRFASGVSRVVQPIERIVDEFLAFLIRATPSGVSCAEANVGKHGEEGLVEVQHAHRAAGHKHVDDDDQGVDGMHVNVDGVQGDLLG